MSTSRWSGGLNHPGLVLACCLTAVGSGDPGAPDLDPSWDARLAAIHRLIRPQPGESAWAAVPWTTDLAEARRRAAAEDKPIFVWRAGGGGVLGRA